MREADIPDRNIFMICERLNEEALSKLPEGYHIRTCTEEELTLWKGFPFDSEAEKKRYFQYMTEYFDRVYGDRAAEFYKRCLFVCGPDDRPVATCFLWKAYQKINTIHWFKTLKEYEGKGLGRALLSHIMAPLREGDYPVLLHTQPGSFRAIGLYSSLGFKIVTNPKVGYRENHYRECLPILKEFMTRHSFAGLEFAAMPEALHEIAMTSKINQF